MTGMLFIPNFTKIHSFVESYKGKGHRDMMILEFIGLEARFGGSKNQTGSSNIIAAASR
jgi:hypothetical protein